MVTRNVVLTDEQDAMIHELVASGRYQNASEALRAGLRLLEKEEDQARLLQNRLSLGLEQARSGALASGTGLDAVKDAFAEALKRRQSQ